MSKFLIAAGYFLVYLFVCPPADAHRVNIFAWVEGDRVHTESRFSNSKPVRGGTVIVFDPQGKALLSGKTDEQGFFSFSAPAMTDLKVVLDASMGHRAEWLVAAADLAPSAPAPETARPLDPPPTIAGRDVIPADEGLEKILDAVLERRLQPIERALMELRQPGPNLRDVVGGLGYIFGMMGIAAYFRCRKK
ncbi:MAG: cobalamin biosynthesis protein CbiL [Desulfuromonadaceae bacterium]|nr:cobalamin biosynthesis protein CbiL [Desulfuromonadaceae bacterium]